MECKVVDGNPTITFEKTPVRFEQAQVCVDDFCVDYPGEYEKSSILLEVEEFEGNLVYLVSIDGRKCVFLPSGVQKIEGEVNDFMGNVDILLVEGTKENAKLVEKVDPKIVVPYGPGKSTLLGSMGQNAEPESKRTLKIADFESENTLFVNLEE